MPVADCSTKSTVPESKFRRILGIRFFTGSAAEVVNLMEDGGLLVVPAAPALKELCLQTPAIVTLFSMPIS